MGERLHRAPAPPLALDDEAPLVIAPPGADVVGRPGSVWDLVGPPQWDSSSSIRGSPSEHLHQARGRDSERDGDGAASRDAPCGIPPVRGGQFLPERRH